jgi:hypothetical protein
MSVDFFVILIIVVPMFLLLGAVVTQLRANGNELRAIRAQLEELNRRK